MLIKDLAFKHIVDSLHDGLYLVDRERIITYWNPAAEAVTGFTAAEVVGKSCQENILTHVDSKGNSLCSGLCPLAQTMVDGENQEAEIYMHHKDGHRIPVSVRTSVLKDQEGNIVGGVELFTDISSLKANEMRVKELEKMALLDSLTRLANRNYIERELHNRFEEWKRHQVSVGILFMDIDHFKQINDTYGHDVGDQILKAVANTFISNARPFDLYGRWGGEEFIALLRNVSAEELVRVGDRMRMLVEKSYLMEKGRKVRVTISIGATLIQDKDTAKELVKRADSLLYRSKEAGRNCLSFG